MYSGTSLFPNDQVAKGVTEYSIESSTPMTSIINQHREATIAFAKSEGLNPNMMINTLQASLSAHHLLYCLAF